MDKATGTLIPLALLFLSVSVHTTGEEPTRFDGRWQTWYTKGQMKSYVIEFTGDRFHAVDGEQWYKGEIVLDTEAAPPQIDFVIRECVCGFRGQTSTGIFRWTGDEIEIRAPIPGDPRPTEFDEKAGDSMRLVRADD